MRYPEKKSQDVWWASSLLLQSGECTHKSVEGVPTPPCSISPYITVKATYKNRNSYELGCMKIPCRMGRKVVWRLPSLRKISVMGNAYLSMVLLSDLLGGGRVFWQSLVTECQIALLTSATSPFEVLRTTRRRDSLSYQERGHIKS